MTAHNFSGVEKQLCIKHVLNHFIETTLAAMEGSSHKLTEVEKNIVFSGGGGGGG
jgi:hypothetical protein